MDLRRYAGHTEKPDNPGKPDSVLFIIDDIIKKEPKLMYAPHIAYSTFSSLLKTNLRKAYECGKALTMESFTFRDPGYNVVIDVIEWNSDKMDIPVEIYQVGAEAYQLEIDLLPYPEIIDIPKLYSKMAVWYWRANNKPKAIAAQQKAIEAIKNKAVTESAVFEIQLQQYRNN